MARVILGREGRVTRPIGGLRHGLVLGILRCIALCAALLMGASVVAAQTPVCTQVAPELTIR